MNNQAPIFTEKSDCQDCYKCVRNCPVKSIKIENGSAMVMHDHCILCGGCVEVCPSGAKKVRDDLQNVKDLLKSGNKVILSLAPSYISEFPDAGIQQIVTGLKSLGFYGISETALGAQEVSANVAELLNNSQDSAQKIFISSACPSVVEYITKYETEKACFLTPFLSPMLSHTKILKKMYGPDISIVFAGPCIAKKLEKDKFPELIDEVITFEDLKLWLKEENIEIENSDNPENSDDCFIPFKAFEGTLYPVEGGMNSGIKANISAISSNFISISGISNISKALKGLENFNPTDTIFLELLACEGGCTNGPKADPDISSVIKRLKVINNSHFSPDRSIARPAHNIECGYDKPGIPKKSYSEIEIREVFLKTGKISQRDELNCAGCGYNTCRDFAVSLLEGKSELKQCVTYMRSLAQKKANALIKTMPSGVVIVDDKLKIVECNEIFARLMGDDTLMMYNIKPGLEGAYIQKIIPFYRLFQNVLDSGIDIVGKEIEMNKTVLLSSIFTIEKNRFAGGIFRDITEPWVRKEQIIGRARQVIKKNLSTVQKIAFLLGENAAETEVILNGIVESFSTDKIDEPDNDED